MSFGDLLFVSPYLTTAFKTGVIALAEGIAVGRSFSMFKNDHIDGNKEMIAIGMMNVAGSCTSCYLTTGPFPRSAVNYNAGCKTAMSYVVMAIAVMFTLLFLTPLFHYTPLVVLSAIIIAPMLGLIDYEAAIHLWKVAISVIRVLLFVARPRTFVQGNLPNSMVYRNVEQYPNASNVPGILILEIDAPIYFANTNYLRERITRWINDEEDRIKSAGESSLQYVILDMTAVGNLDTSGISMFEEVKKLVDRRGLQLVLGNPGSEVMKKMKKSELIEKTCQGWIYLTVAEAVAACNFMLHSTKPNPGKDQEPAAWNNVCWLWLATM
ncbi:sulfate transporter 3.1 [Prunus yedoensis var. nudiflora]|uniref:Sulfate transporter 3.1 n=1 Tax=Prunus yedoensis var. nudiflora TaxID=2094558 RepID=A0A314Z1F3_PRUYE|nr:sulfate transporter 3.1 [Prunus yedoensis var. nudiflora]